MAKSLAEAQQNYANSASYASNNWNAAKPTMASHWAQGVSEFIGAPVGPSTRSKYETKINNAQHKMGDPNKWAQRYREKMTR